MQKITVNNKDYYLKVTTSAIMNMEERLGIQPINIFARFMRTEELPKLTDVLIMLHCALQPLNAGVSFNDVKKMYDDICAETGNGFEAVMEPLLLAFKESGFIKFEEDPNV